MFSFIILLAISYLTTVIDPKLILRYELELKMQCFDKKFSTLSPSLFKTKTLQTRLKLIVVA